ncbi:OLC1v1029895C1 [Oldenlandia corymbosa var. corymbosa]|uniref:OLC1v1029895C1 n=1 Tax=Oldenlandia corymbosa var. corymbosa TaxID=529605 RepID=A0AAV1CFM0_OLDCO|nr:OLC1v1029895C1 [Oldenlandia corymbosa var. corymbosa]
MVQRINYRTLQCRVILCGISIFLLFSFVAKMKDGVSITSKSQNHAYINGVVSVLDAKNGFPCDEIEALDCYHSVFEKLLQQGYLRPASKSLCINCAKDQELVAMRDSGNGVSDVAVEYSGKKIAPLSASGLGFLSSFSNDTFDFEFFSSRIDVSDIWSVHPSETASEVCRILKHGGYLIVHISIKDEYSFQSFVNLFDSCGLLRFRDIKHLNSSHWIREAIFTKNTLYHSVSSFDHKGRCQNGEMVPKYKWDLIDSLEPLAEKEPQEDWTEAQKYQEAIKSFKYVPNLVDLRFKKRYIYVDLGARTYASTIGNWFLKLYPKQSNEFHIFAIEADKAFHKEYKNRKGVTLLPYAAWIKNGTLVFGTRNKKREYTGRIQQQESVITRDYAKEQNIVQAFDFADWLIRSFTRQDYVVLKMDVEGSEMEMVPKLVETGAIGLIDEVFIECHYDRWVKCCSGRRTQRYNTTYEQCYNLFSKLRQHGTVVHQWW